MTRMLRAGSVTSDSPKVPARCPHCHHSGSVYAEHTVRGKTVAVALRCGACGAVWHPQTARPRKSA